MAQNDTCSTVECSCVCEWVCVSYECIVDADEDCIELWWRHISVYVCVFVFVFIIRLYSSLSTIVCHIVLLYYVYSISKRLTTCMDVSHRTKRQSTFSERDNSNFFSNFMWIFHSAIYHLNVSNKQTNRLIDRISFHKFHQKQISFSKTRKASQPVKRVSPWTHIVHTHTTRSLQQFPSVSMHSLGFYLFRVSGIAINYFSVFALTGRATGGDEPHQIDHSFRFLIFVLFFLEKSWSYRTPETINSLTERRLIVCLFNQATGVYGKHVCVCECFSQYIPCTSCVWGTRWCMPLPAVAFFRFVCVCVYV